MDPLPERDEWRYVWVAGNGGQFALAIKNWQEPFVHKWDTSLKVSTGNYSTDKRVHVL